MLISDILLMSCIYSVMIFVYSSSDICEGGTGGDRFVFTFPHQYYSDAICVIHMASFSGNDVTANITAPATGYHHGLVISGLLGEWFELPEDLCTRGYQSTDIPQTLIVDTSECITLHAEGVQENYIGSSDIFTAIPERELGNDYIVVSYPPNESFDKSEFTITSPFGENVVTIRFSNDTQYEGVSYGHGDTLTLTMTAYQTIQFQSSSDLTGTRITSSKPVAVISGNSCNIVREGGNHDFFVEQMLPVDKWGREFTIAPFTNQSFGYIYRVIAAENDTSVEIGGQTIILQEGQTQDGDVDSFEVTGITSSKPVLVVQFMKSDITEYAFDDTGPSMTIINSNSQFSSQKIVFISTTYDFGLYVTIVILSGSLSSFTVDDMALANPSFDSNPIIVHQELLGFDERHVIESVDSSARFAVYVYSTGSAISYVFPAAFTFDCESLGKP